MFITCPTHIAFCDGAKLPPNIRISPKYFEVMTYPFVL